MEKNILKNFMKYVSLNILGMIGLSCYILADTYFIAQALGSSGIVALNFSISIYSVIHGTGLMIGIGGATRYSILKYQKEEKKSNQVFTTSIKLGICAGVILAMIGILGSNSLAILLGADSTTLPLTKTYLTMILCFAPFFIMNNILLAFVRNDNDPKLSMIAMLTGSFSNILLDYLFMFPLKLGMFGAAFATGLAPIISLGVLSLHFIKRKNQFRYIHSKADRSTISYICSVGLASFVTEISSAVVLITFNLVILKLRGNLGVASYGIVANLALVGMSVYTGIAQGIQPLISKGFGMKNSLILKKVMRYALITSLVVATLIYLVVYLNTDLIIAIFNSEKDSDITQIVITGLRIYFTGFFFAGINIIMAMYLSSTEYAKEAFLISIARGCIIIVPMVLLLGKLWNMTGVWLSFGLTELIVALMILIIRFIKGKNNIK